MAEMVKQESRNEAPRAERTHGGVTYTPRVDILELDDELTIFGDLPGVTSEDLDIQFENRELTIYGKVAPRPQGAPLRSVYGEYGIGDFYRVFAIGQDIDAGRISAELKDGVLVIHLPKAEAVKPRRIEVKTG